MLNKNELFTAKIKKKIIDLLNVLAFSSLSTLLCSVCLANDADLTNTHKLSSVSSTEKKIRDNIPNKVISIYNNSNTVIYPIIETSITNTDQWLQARFRATNLAQHRYPHTELYRVYINPKSGLAPGKTVTVNLPFYSQLVAQPSPILPNQYINWWNGGRVYIYDDATAVQNAYNQDQSHVITPLTAGASCSSSSQCEPVKIFSNTVGLPLNDPYQLAEYTFANVVTSIVPYTIDVNYVDYDLSYVDHVYLPLALEPHGNASIGYTGTTRDLPGFRSILNKFVSETSWPFFIQKPPFPNKKLPGAYNLLIGSNLSSTNSLAKQKMQALWDKCTTTSINSPLCKNIRTVFNLFSQNYINYTKLACSTHLPLTKDLMLQHVYGWVPFNECPEGGIDNALYFTPGVDYNNAVNAYHAAQYSTGSEQFNPFVQFIHGQNYLNMTAYAYSIDDAVGNMNQLGDGMIIAIGGDNGLSNKNPYNPAKILNVNLGAPAAGMATWQSFGVCKETPDKPLNGSLNIQIGSVSFPCTISIKDSKNNLYKLNVAHEPPITTTDVNCTAAKASWCQGVIVDPNTKKDLNTPPTIN